MFYREAIFDCMQLRLNTDLICKSMQIMRIITFSLIYKFLFIKSVTH